MRTLWLDFLLQAGDAPPAAPEGGQGAGDPGNPFGMFLPLIVIFFIFWFLVFRPESKKRKERERKVKAIKKGDEVITNGGILGKVMKVDDSEVVLRVDKDKDVRIRFAKSALLDVFPPGTSDKEREAGDQALKQGDGLRS